MTDYQHFILSNRDVKRKNGKYFLKKKAHINPYNQLHSLLYAIPEGANVNSKTIIKDPVTPVVAKRFVDEVLGEAKKLKAPYKNITLYIHGFNHLFCKSYKVELFQNLAKTYCSGEDRSVGKFIFFSWPATDLRSKMDDMIHVQGEAVALNYLAMFEKLQERLADIGVELNLMSHSFGHRWVNGFLGKTPARQGKLFDKTFLFASDIPYQSIATNGLPGIRLKNKGESRFDGGDNEKTRLYDLTKLEQLSTAVYGFHCDYDRMLFASTDGELNEREEKSKTDVDNFMCLGVVGNTNSAVKHPKNFAFNDVTPLVLSENYEALKDEKVKKELDKIRSEKEFDTNQRLFAIKGKDWIHLHRYLFTSPKVVSKVKELLQS